MHLHKNIKILKWFNFFTDLRLYAPIAILYFSQVSGSYALGMSIFAVTMISSAVFEVPTGIFSDLIGRKKTMVLGAFAAFLYSIFYAVGSSYLILIFGAIFEGLSRAFYSGNDEALLYDSLSDTNDTHRFDEFLGKLSAMFQIALAVSAIFVIIFGMFPIAILVWLSIIPQFFCFVLSFFIKEPRSHSNKSGNIFSHLKIAISLFFKNKKLRLLSLSSILGYGFGEASYQFQAAFFQTLWPVWAIGIAKVLSNIGAAASFHFSHIILKKYNGLKILIVDNVYNRIINIFSTAFPTIFSPLIMATSSIFFGVTSVAKGVLLQKEFSDEQRATMGSLNSFAGSLVFGILAVLLGLTADMTSPARAFLILQIFQIINIWFYFKLWKLYDRDNAKAYHT